MPSSEKEVLVEEMENLNFKDRRDLAENLALNSTPIKRYYSGFGFNTKDGIVDLNNLKEIKTGDIKKSILSKLDSQNMQELVSKEQYELLTFYRFNYVNFNFRYFNEVE